MTKYKPCPKCKSKEGYMYLLLVEYNQWIDLNGKEINADPSGGEINKPKMFECIGCHSRFRKNTLELGD